MGSIGRRPFLSLATSEVQSWHYPPRHQSSLPPTSGIITMEVRCKGLFPHASLRIWPVADRFGLTTGL